MNTKALVLTFSLAVAGANVANAQNVSSNVSGGAILGGIAGAFIGGHNDDRWGEGALIGAAAGALLGAAADAPRTRTVTYGRPVQVVQSVPVCAQLAQVVYVQPPRPARVVYVTQAPQARVVYVQQPCTPAPFVVVQPSPHHRRRGHAVIYVTPEYRGW